VTLYNVLPLALRQHLLTSNTLGRVACHHSKEMSSLQKTVDRSDR